jgi:hypothetical protein
MNAMGWTDTSQYDKRYGKRTGNETLKEARTLISKKPEDNDPVPKAIERLALLLSEGKIDIQTYQASIVALKKDKPTTSNNVPGYR